ncbi:MAG: TetR/AcrR family transcriptional regulator [Chthoniobacteraceae bacterium]
MSNDISSPTRRSADTRERILEAAIELFAKNGFAGTTTKQIARLAKKNEALIFRYFPTKKDLYAAIIQRKISRRSSVELMEALNADPSDNNAFLRELVSKVICVKSEDTQFLRLLYFSALEGHELSQLFFDTYAKQLRAQLNQFMKAGMEAGRFRKMDPRLASRALIGMLAHYQVATELFHFEPDMPSPAEAAQVFVDIFLNGISTQKPGVAKLTPKRKKAVKAILARAS